MTSRIAEGSFTFRILMIFTFIMANFRLVFQLQQLIPISKTRKAKKNSQSNLYKMLKFLNFFVKTIKTVIMIFKNTFLKFLPSHQFSIISLLLQVKLLMFPLQILNGGTLFEINWQNSILKSIEYLTNLIQNHGNLKENTLQQCQTSLSNQHFSIFSSLSIYWDHVL